MLSVRAWAPDCVLRAGAVVVLALAGPVLQPAHAQDDRYPSVAAPRPQVPQPDKAEPPRDTRRRPGVPHPAVATPKPEPAVTDPPLPPAQVFPFAVGERSAFKP